MYPEWEASTARNGPKFSHVTSFVLTLQRSRIIRSVKVVTQPRGQDSITGMGWGLASSTHRSYSRTQSAPRALSDETKR